MKLLLKICFLFFLAASATAQQQDFRLYFSSDDKGNYLPFDSIYIKNLDQAGDTTLFYPDTILNLDFAVGIKDTNPKNEFSTGRNYPNPFRTSTKFTLYIPGQDVVSIQIFDLTGRKVAAFSGELAMGNHSFTYNASSKGLFIASICYKEGVESIKMICSNSESTSGSFLQYDGMMPSSNHSYKRLTDNNFEFSTGNRLLCIMYAGVQESGFVKKAYDNDTLIFQYATGIPCVEQPEINFMGQVYRTVQIRGQCWMSENMNAGMMIAGQDDPSDNGLIEKYCYDDDPANCNIYGGMYQWNEIMKYTEGPMAQGICPPGWHVPADEEWTILEAVADSIYNIRDDVWSAYGLRGYDAAYNLKSTNGWNENGNGSDAFGFNAMPAGTRSNFGDFILLGRNAPFWSSTKLSEIDILYRILLNTSDQVYRYDFESDSGFGLRCVRDM